MVINNLIDFDVSFEFAFAAAPDGSSLSGSHYSERLQRRRKLKSKKKDQTEQNTNNVRTGAAAAGYVCACCWLKLKQV